MKLNIIYLVSTVAKTVYVNFHYLPVRDAIKLPIWIAGDVKLGKLGSKGCLTLGLKKTGTVRFGFGGSFNLGGGGYFHINGTCRIHGKFSCGRGIQFLVGANADAEFGNNFEANSNCIINAGNKEVYVGNDVILGWGTTILAANGHKILYKSEETVDDKTQEFLLDMLRKYNNKSVGYMIELSHKTNPWANNYEIRAKNPIPMKDMEEEASHSSI